MITAADLAARRKIKAVKDQIEYPRAAGEMAVITCPYCGQLNMEGQNFCCETLRMCVVTILMGKRQDAIERAQERHANN